MADNLTSAETFRSMTRESHDRFDKLKAQYGEDVITQHTSKLFRNSEIFTENDNVDGIYSLTQPNSCTLQFLSLRTNCLISKTRKPTKMN